MYVKDMTLATAHATKQELETILADPNTRHDNQQVEWDLEDVNGRISELTDWY